MNLKSDGIVGKSFSLYMDGDGCEFVSGLEVRWCCESVRVRMKSAMC